MRLMKTALALLCLFWLAGCTFQSTVILPDAKAAGDPIAGLPLDGPFKLESFDRQKGAYHQLGTMTPEKMADGKVRYTFAFTEDDPKKLLVQAEKISESDYILRYAQLGDGAEPNINESALFFLKVEDGTYYVLTSLADRKLFETVFSGVERPRIVSDSMLLDSVEQGRRLSAYFSAHRAEFLMDQDYVRMRVMR
jgi:hypothetical protein